jgi:hypothetical protein
MRGIDLSVHYRFRFKKNGIVHALFQRQLRFARNDNLREGIGDVPNSVP